MAREPKQDPTKRLTLPELLRRVAGLPPEEQKRAERALVHQYAASTIVDRTPEASELEAKGWEAWLAELAPHVFKGTHGPFHRAFWDWYWPLLLAKRDGKRLVSFDIPLAYLMTLARGLGKSTTAEWAVIAMGAILGEILIVYVSSTAKLAANHLNNIREEIESSQISKYYPGLAHPEVGKQGNRYGWKADLLAARSGLTVFAVGLEEEVRGLKRKQHRPAFIILDEFDSKSDSPDVVRKKEAIIGGSIFGTQVPDTIILMCQNLIHGQSVATRTFKRRNELLGRRRESGLINAFTDDLEIGMDGTRWVIMKGKPVWDYFDEAGFQKFLDSSGPIETYAEYQNRFDKNKEGKAFPNFLDKDAIGFTHIITEADFRRKFGVDRPPPSWNKYIFNDKARTKTEWHANVAGTLTMSGMNTPLPGITFLYDCLSSEADTQPDDFAVEILKCITPKIYVNGQYYKWEELLRTIITRDNIDRFTHTVKEQITAQRAGLARILPKYVKPLLTSQRYVRLRMSHEADDWRRVYRDTFGLHFEPAVPREGEGVELVNLAMKVDKTVQCPFGRVYYDPETGELKPVMGMARFYIIVKDDKVKFPDDNKPDLLHGSDLARYQLTEHRWLPPRLNALGELEQGLEKRNDDFTNGLQFFYYDNCIKARELTQQEMAEALMDPRLQLATIEAEADPEVREKSTMARQIALKQELQSRIARQLSGGKAGSKLADYRSLMRRR